MNPLRKIRALLFRRKLDAEMAEEMRAHVELQTQANLAAGMAPEEARYAARWQFGGADQIKERVRDQRGFVRLEQLGQDLRYASRQLARAKGFTAVVVLTLALGIGATTAIYSVVQTVLFHPVPGPNPDRIVQVGEQAYMGRETVPTMSGMTPHVLEALQDRPDFFSEQAWADSAIGSFERKADGFVASISGCAVSPNFFRLFGVRPLLGRTFAVDEAVPLNMQTRLPDQDAAIVLSYPGWQTLFAGTRDVVGQTLDLSGHRYTVVGVMPAWFQFPLASIQFWVATQPLHLPPNRSSVGNARFVARLKPGVTMAQLQASLDLLAQQLSSDPSMAWQWKRSGVPSGVALWVRPLGQALIGGSYDRGADDVRRMLLGLTAAIGFVLLIVCANVANLMLARTERRQHELAVRAALGAGRGRLMRQLLAESVLLAVLGGMGGLLVTAWAMKILVVLNTIPRLRPVEVDGQVLGIALVVSLLTALAFGLMPAWRGARPGLNQTLAQSGVGSTAAIGGRRYRSTLVVVQVALTVVLLTGAGLMIQSVVRLLRVEPGYDPENLVVVIPVPPNRLRQSGASLDSRNQFYAQVREQLAAVPGVASVGLWKNGAYAERITVEGRTEPMDAYRGATGVEESDFFRVARVPLLAGRYLEARDVGEKVGTVLINETMAQRCWPGEDAIGKKFRAREGSGDRAGGELCEVVGVVADIRSYKYDEERHPTFFRPLQEASPTGAPVWAVVRTTLAPGLVMPALRRELRTVDPEMKTPYLSLPRQTLYDATQPRRTYRNYLVGFAGMGLLLSSLGVYGVLAYTVARRTREIGIRLAVGAERRHVMTLVLGEGARLIATGLGIGLIAACWLTQYLQKQLFEIGPRDPAVLIGVMGVLALVALAACWLPARVAAAVDPVVALRTE